MAIRKMSVLSFFVFATVIAGAKQMGKNDGAEPVFRVSRIGGGYNILSNSDFEKGRSDGAESWFGWQKGYVWDPQGGRGGSAGVFCENVTGEGEYGVGQTLTLNRKTVAPLVVSGWSKAQGVSGTPDSGYSLYVDIIYTDDTPLWGANVPFSCGNHDWEFKRLVIQPEKPVKSVTVYGLFRGHSGKVWFDDITLTEMRPEEGFVLFQGTAVQVPSSERTVQEGTSQVLATKDGLRIRLQGGVIRELLVHGKRLTGGPSGFLVRDVAADSDWYAFDGLKSDCRPLGLRLEAVVVAGKDHIRFQGRLSDLRGKDRAVTLVFALPVTAAGWSWSDDLRRSRPIDGPYEFANTTFVGCGATGNMSLYPLAAIQNKEVGLAIGINMERPALYRLVYHPGTRQFLIAYDFGLAPDSGDPKGSAAFDFVVFTFDPSWKMRAAMKKFISIFPDHFRKRVEREGIWMPFTDISTVEGFEDFGFAFQEGAPNVPFDETHNIYSFPYVEPMSHWIPLPPEVPRTYEAALQTLKEDSQGKRDPWLKDMAVATLTSALQGRDGRFALTLIKAPWCDGGVFLLNPDPKVPTSPQLPLNKATVMLRVIQDFMNRYNTKEAQVDGVYLDSLEMGATTLNYRREHWSGSPIPLVFDSEGSPCQMLIFNTFEFARFIAHKLHNEGKLVFANAVLWRFSFPAAVLDILGTEVNWMRGGQYQPDPDTVMLFRRTLSYQKPYCLLMNTNYELFTPQWVEKYMERCLFYGIFPSFFDEEAASKDPYWASPKKWYNRDRHLFKKYIPLIQRIAQAGWEPITYARSNNPKVYVERYGPSKKGDPVYFTIMNDHTSEQHAVIDIDTRALGLKRDIKGVEKISKSKIAIAAGRFSTHLTPGQVWLVEVTD
ncbi:MAG: hypothetical protein NZ959_07785 [Armatimonadetes bacterium]|nr:hypothetical protein [Armatimonadota bacterium]MDW8121685.1 hypothetical protein [Armatimonadota bacterium]